MKYTIAYAIVEPLCKVELSLQLDSPVTFYIITFCPIAKIKNQAPASTVE